jgi:acetyl esterase/lipase
MRIDNLEYSRPADGAPLQLDLHIPENRNARPLPVIVWLHGGGWRGGNRLTPPLIALQHGYAIAAVEYRLSGRATWPAQIDDCKNAIRYVRTHAKEHGLDPNQIVAFGKSAGGHLAALIATMTGASINDTDRSCHVAAACDYCGPADLNRYTDPKLRAEFAVMHEVIVSLLGGPIEEHRELARHASPDSHATANCPPLLIAHGEADKTVPVEDSRILYDALKKAGAADVELRVLPGVGHHIASVDMETYVMKFFDRVLGRA